MYRLDECARIVAPSVATIKIAGPGSPNRTKGKAAAERAVADIDGETKSPRTGGGPGFICYRFSETVQAHPFSLVNLSRCVIYAHSILQVNSDHCMRVG